MRLKPISREGIPAALQKAERYRLLNDSSAAESICLDILEVEADNQQALITLLLSITDQFVDDTGDEVRRARDVLPRLKDDYKRAYYSGIIAERKAKALLHRGGMGVDEVAHDWFREAMKFYEKAESQRPPGNDEAILRWNTCARLLGKHEPKRPTRDELQPVLGE
jgi:hypothetical protein